VPRAGGVQNTLEREIFSEFQEVFADVPRHDRAKLVIDADFVQLARPSVNGLEMNAFCAPAK